MKSFYQLGFRFGRRYVVVFFAFLLLVACSNAFSSVTYTDRSKINSTTRNRNANEIKVSSRTKESPSSLHVTSSSSVFSSDDSDNDNSSNNANSRRIEFADLGSIEHSSERRQRIEQEQEDRERFIKYGDELWELRQSMDELSHGLLKAINHGERGKEEDIRQELRRIENQDPDLVYEIELEKLHAAMLDGRVNDAEKHSVVASAARRNLPQYNLDGLWVGKYGHHGYEMINVTYQGDLLIAYKVTGDKNVPRGEITFQADLNPLRRRRRNVGNNDPSSSSSTATAMGARNIIDNSSSAGAQDMLQPINLTEKAAKKWGTTQLPRHKGLGQVAEPGFKNSQWMSGQLIIIGDEYFSFAWVPIEQQIFFGRPSPELALKMLRESGASTISPPKTWEEPPTIDSDVEVLKDYVSSCLEKTAEGFEEDESNGKDPFGCIWTGGEECYFQ